MDPVGRELVELHHGRGEFLEDGKYPPDNMDSDNVFHAVEDRLLLDFRLF